MWLIRFDAVTDRYGLSREFSLRQFEMQIMKCEDLYQLQEMCIQKAVQPDHKPTGCV